MFVSVTPFFDEKMNVKAYCFLAQKGSYLMTAEGIDDPLSRSAHSQAFDYIRLIGLEALTDNRPLFIPINNLALIFDLAGACTAPPEQIIFVIDSSVPPTEMYISKIAELKEKGFSFAIRGIKNIGASMEMLKHMEYIFLEDEAYNLIEGKKPLLYWRFKASTETHGFSKYILLSK